jgi:hypothetical protein
MHRHDEDPVGGLVVAVQQEHPRPGTEGESNRRPPSPQLRAREREGFKHSQRASDPGPGISRKVEVSNRFIHVPLRSRADDYLRHSSQLVERNTFSPLGLSETLLSALPSAGDCVENLRDPTGIRICIIERRREQRTSEGSLLHVGPLSEPRKLVGVIFVQGHVDSLRVGSHGARIAQIYTARVTGRTIVKPRYAPGWIRTSDRRIRRSAGRCPAGRIVPDRADHVQGVRLSSLELGTNFGTKFSRTPHAPLAPIQLRAIRCWEEAGQLPNRRHR